MQGLRRKVGALLGALAAGCTAGKRFGQGRGLDGAVGAAGRGSVTQRCGDAMGTAIA